MKKLYASLNHELNALDIHKDKECYQCGRKYPDTILNIEGTIHHKEEPRCLDYRSCRRAKRQLLNRVA